MCFIRMNINRYQVIFQNFVNNLIGVCDESPPKMQRVSETLFGDWICLTAANARPDENSTKVMVWRIFMKNIPFMVCIMWYKNLSTVSAILHSTIIVHKMARIFY